MSNQRKRLWQLAKVVLVLIFIFLIVHFLQKYSADLSNVFLLKPLDFAKIGFWLLLSYIAYAYGVFLILQHLGLRDLALLAWIRIYFASRFVNFFVIQGGNLFRLLVLKKRYGFAYANSIGINVMLVWLNATVALTLCAIGVFFAHSVEPPIRAQVWIAVAAMWLLPITAWLFLAIIDRVPDRIKWLRQHLRSAAAVCTETLGKGSLAAGLITLSTLHFLFFVGVNQAAFLALANDVGLTETLVFTTAVSFTRYINIVPGNIGLAELVGGLVSQILGAGFGDGLIVVGMVRIIEFFMIIAIGVLDGNAQIWTFIRDRKTVRPE